MIWEGARMERWSYGGREMAQVDRRGGGVLFSGTTRNSDGGPRLASDNGSR